MYNKTCFEFELYLIPNLPCFPRRDISVIHNELGGGNCYNDGTRRSGERGEPERGGGLEGARRVGE